MAIRNLYLLPFTCVKELNQCIYSSYIHFYFSTERKYFEVKHTDFGKGGQKNPEVELKGHLDARVVHGEDGQRSLLKPSQLF